MRHRKTGILGGTFDPIHHGHLSLARQAMQCLHLDAIVFIPTYQPPHKEWAPYASYAHRYRMIEIAIEDDPQLFLSDIEKRRGGVSYTFDTIMELKQLEPNTDWYFISGSDAYDYFMTWHRWRDLLDVSKIVIAKRPGYTITPNETLEAAVRKSSNGMKYIVVDTPDISSTMIRALLAIKGSEGAVQALVPNEVFDYIRANNLYQEESNADTL